MWPPSVASAMPVSAGPGASAPPSGAILSIFAAIMAQPGWGRSVASIAARNIRGSGCVAAVTPPDDGLVPGGRGIAHPSRVGFGHHRRQHAEPDFALPSEQPARLAGVAEQQLDLGRTVKSRVDAHDCPPAAPVDAAFLRAAAGPFEVEVEMFRRRLDEFPH